MTSIVSDFRHIFLGTEPLGLEVRLQALLIIIVILFLSLIIFNKVDKEFVDNI